MKNILFTAIALTIAIISCKKEEKDSEKPEIRIVEPANNDTLYTGHDVHLEMELSDNEMLHSYKIEIHNNFNGHNHTKSTSDSGAWQYNKSWDVSGNKNKHIHHHEIVIPDSIQGKALATGEYHFSVYCSDRAGNESLAVIDVFIANQPNGHEHDDDHVH